MYRRIYNSLLPTFIELIEAKLHSVFRTDYKEFVASKYRESLLKIRIIQVMNGK